MASFGARQALSRVTAAIAVKASGVELLELHLPQSEGDRLAPKIGTPHALFSIRGETRVGTPGATRER